jgi:hypothetical protein
VLVRKLVATAAVAISVIVSGSATAETVNTGKAEIFATNQTATILDPHDPRLRTRLVKFAHQVNEIIRDNGGKPRGSTLLNGTFWSSALRQASYERSREFHVASVTSEEVQDIAHKVATRFHQQSVLTFQYFPRSSPKANAVLVEVPGVDFQRLHETIESNPVFGERLGGGSVTLQDRLIEVGAREDLPLIRQLVRAVGGNWRKATIHYGAWQFVS